MARAFAQKKVTDRKSRRIGRPGQKVSARKQTAMKSKASGRTAKVKGTAEKTRKAPSSAQHPANKERIIMEAESKPAFRTGSTSALDASSRLLRQTKTTSAALALLEKGIELIFQKEFKKARVELKSLLESYPAETDILARARSYIQICEREEATQKKSSIPNDQLYTLGVMEHNKANYDVAISYFLQSLENHPDADYIYYSLAASRAMKGDFSKAIENLRKAIELNEDSRVYAKNDSDFSALQTHREFTELLGIAQQLLSES
jgi:tetratricopeptide (TPR) repeat protein